MELKLDWSHFTRRIFIERPVEEIFKLWTTQSAYEAWFLESAKFFRDGKLIGPEETIRASDEYIWKWYGWQYDHPGKIIEVIENKLLRFDFGKGGDVLIEFMQMADGRTELKLRQYNIPVDEDSMRNYFYGCTMGWSFWMTNCKAYAEHGITLNDKNNPLPDDIKAQLVNA